jgi:hypothetical protein
MISLDKPLVLPDPLNETDGMAAVVSARLDLHNQSITLEYAYGNLVNGRFVGSSNLPAVPVMIRILSGEVYVRGNFVGWLDAASLAAAQASVGAFSRNAETFATGVMVSPPNPDGTKSDQTNPLVLFSGTVA